MNIVFLGTPEFAVPVLTALIKSRHKVLAAVSQPDREADRKGKLRFTPVKEFALKNGVRILQYQKVSAEGLEEIKELKPEVMVTAAFGQILSGQFLDLAPVFNVHASILPAYRGAAPIQSAIINGEKNTGVTIMRTVREMDAGEILLNRKLTIGDDETYGDLSLRLAGLGGELIVNAIDLYEKGDLKAVPQNHEKATFTKKITKSDGKLDFNESAEKIALKIRAFNPWPTGQARYNGETIKIYTAKAVKTNSMPHIIHGLNIESAINGAILCANEKDGLIIKCGTDALKIERLQSPGKKILDTPEFLRGYKMAVGKLLSDAKIVPEQLP